MILKTCSRSKISKRPWRSKAYKAHVGSHPCLVCGVPSGPPHHIREMFLRTMGRQIGDEWMVPLCLAHHTLLHSSSKRFWMERGINPIAWCESAYARWKEAA